MRSSQAPPITPLTAWSTLAILSGLNMFNYLDRYVMSAVLTPMEKDLSLNDGDAGWAASAFMLGYFVTAPFFGYLGDRFPRKYLMLGGVIVWSLATAGSGLAHSFAALFVIRIVVGVGEACFVAIPFGSAIGFTIGGHFAESGDWRGAFIYAGLPGVILALLLLTIREPQRGQSDGVGEKAVPKANPGEVAGLFTNRRYNLLVWGYAAQTFSIGAFANWGPTFLHRVHGMSLGSSGTVFGAMLAITGLVATLVGGFVANALRRRTAAGYVWVMAMSMVAATPVCFFALMVGNVTLSLIGLGTSMFFLFLPAGPIASEIFEIVPVHLRSSAMAMATFVIHFFGDFGSPTIVGQVSTFYGNDLQKGVLLLPFVLTTGAILWCILIRFTREPLKVEV
jgi:MFS family permease